MHIIAIQEDPGLVWPEGWEVVAGREAQLALAVRRPLFVKLINSVTHLDGRVEKTDCFTGVLLVEVTLLKPLAGMSTVRVGVAHFHNNTAEVNPGAQGS